MPNKIEVLENDPSLNENELSDLDNFINSKNEQPDFWETIGFAEKPINEVLFLTLPSQGLRNCHVFAGSCTSVGP